MKIIALLTAAALATGVSSSLLAQDETQQQADQARLKANAERLEQELQSKDAKTEADTARLEVVRNQMLATQNQLAQAQQAVQQAVQANNYEVAAKEYENVMQGMVSVNGINSPFLFAGPGADSRSMVISSSETDPKAQAAAEEDLNIMARILTKALSGSGGNEQAKAMGIPITMSAGDTRNFEIEGYGALFLLHVNYPLSGPPAEPVADKPKEESSSTWEEAKQEVYGRAQAPQRGAGSRVKFDPKRVEQLKDDVLNALKNASNIRALKDGESVTVVVSSEDTGPKTAVRLENRLKKLGDGNTSSTGGGGGSGGSSQSWVISPDSGQSLHVEQASGPVMVAHNRSGSHAGSTLTIRAPKSAIEAFAKGKLNLDEFRKRASIALY